jgi:biopolymer transport protein TolR
MNHMLKGGRTGRRRPMAEINVVPYIDVSLVLLVIFMITAPLLQTGVEVDLPPQAEAKTVDPTQELPVLVTVRAGGELLLSVGDQQDVPVDRDSLSQQVLAALKDKPGRPVQIRGDRSAPYGDIMQVMNLLKKAGVRSVGLITRPEE